MTLVIPRGQTAQPEPRDGPVGAPRQRAGRDPAAAQLGLRSDDGQPGPRGDPIQEKPDGNRGPSGFRVTSRFKQSMQPQRVTRAAGTSPGAASTSPGH